MTMDSLVDSTLYLIFNFSRRNGTPVFMDMVNQPLSFYTNLVLAAIVLNYIIAVSRYHWIHRTQGEGQLPPAYPSFLPLIGNLILLLWDNEQLFRRLTSYRGNPTAGRIGIFGHDILFFQDRQSIKRIWKTPSLSSPINISLYTFKFFFGVPEKTLKVYRADNSGPYRKPYAGSTISENRRVDYLAHHEFLRALSGPGLRPTFLRFKRALETGADGAELTNEWTELRDFQKFFQNLFGPSLVESVYGPALHRLSPSFMDDLYDFDDNVPWLARMIPSFIMPRPYRIRNKLGRHFRKWHIYARTHFHESSIYEDGDGDPFWGSAFIRNRHAMFSKVGDHDEDAVVALDIGLAFGLISNASPAALLAAWHIFKDPLLLDRIRNDLREHLGTKSLRDVDPKVVLGIPILQSVYAEVLRLYTNVYVMVSSPQETVNLGRWRLPKNSIALLNSSVSHRDPRFWNTRSGMHPVGTFWADRFLINPRDVSSGPISPAVRETQTGWTAAQRADGDGEPFYSTEGLEASWFPYGGGYSICPGRHLAKNVIIFAAAVLATEFDIEFLTDSLVLDKWRFGLGIAKPTNELPFRIRRRAWWGD